MRSCSSAGRASHLAFTRAVRTMLGATLLAQMPKGPNSTAMCLVNARIPALAALYCGPEIRLKFRPAKDETLTIRPYFCAFITGTAARMQRKADLRLRATV